MEKEFLNLIQSNIDNYGYHVTVVMSDTDPRYAYTIGLSKSLGFELVIAGCYFYLKEDLFTIFNSLVSQLKSDKSIIDTIKTEFLGDFKFSIVHDSWRNLMLLGCFDYYGTKEIKCFQVLPDQKHYTFEIPDMSIGYISGLFSSWEQLDGEWKFSVPKGSMVTTNIQSLQGEKITEVTRWEVDSWEMFAGSGPDVEIEDVRVVPINVILGIDNSLLPALDLDIEEGLWRDSNDLVWHNW